MSRIGRMPIAVPAGVTVDIAENNHVTVKGPKGTLERTLPSEISSRSYKNTDQQHGCWCYQWIYQGTRG